MRWPLAAPPSRPHPIKYPTQKPEIQHTGPQRLVGFGPRLHRRGAPPCPGREYPRKGCGLGSAIQAHKPVGDHRSHADRQCIDPWHAGGLALRGDGIAQRFDGTGVPRGVSARTDLSHALRAAQLLELQRFVLHGELVAAFALAVEPLQEFRGKAEGPAQQTTQERLDHRAPLNSSNLMTAPATSASTRPVVIIRTMVCQAVRLASLKASSRPRNSRMSFAAFSPSRPTSASAARAPLSATRSSSSSNSARGMVTMPSATIGAFIDVLQKNKTRLKGGFQLQKGNSDSDFDLDSRQRRRGADDLGAAHKQALARLTGAGSAHEPAAQQLDGDRSVVVTGHHRADQQGGIRQQILELPPQVGHRALL
uniref:Uncharacterized protein n=1 Tax=Ralstonia solanacearum TaxID=305 RepID=A0A0S4WN87_RALSL|nr:protein of unknown function [Ralstonia solanacearum]